MADRNVFVDMLMSAGKALLSRAANGATEAVLDEVHGAVKEVDRRIAKAKRRVQTHKTGRNPEPEVVDAEFVDEEVH
jgi:hypothetical protein